MKKKKLRAMIETQASQIQMLYRKQDELERMLRELKADDPRVEIRRWHDGYLRDINFIQDQLGFNPKSINFDRLDNIENKINCLLTDFRQMEKIVVEKGDNYNA